MHILIFDTFSLDAKFNNMKKPMAEIIIETHSALKDKQL